MNSCPAVVYDLNGREAAEAGIILDALPHLEQYIFCSSAGVYKKSDEMPHREVDEGDPKSRHKVCLCQIQIRAFQGKFQNNEWGRANGGNGKQDFKEFPLMALPSGCQ